MKKKIMIVDDESSIVSFLKELLSNWGYNTISTDNGLDCFELIDAEKPDLVLLDIMMPGLDGMSVCSEIAINYKIPIIIVSGINDSIAKNNSCTFGAFEFVSKPVDIEEGCGHSNRCPILNGWHDLLVLFADWQSLVE